MITDAALRHLTNLEELDLEGNETITDVGLRHLPNLLKLKLSHNSMITDHMIAKLRERGVTVTRE